MASKFWQSWIWAVALSVSLGIYVGVAYSSILLGFGTYFIVGFVLAAIRIMPLVLSK